MSTGQIQTQRTLFGHPVGLFTLFFAEMWERFSYYGMRALLLFYMIKGFLGYNDRGGYAIYGAYTSLVYMTPFFGGLLADRLLGARRAVVLGGILMAAGHLLMTIQTEAAFFGALALLICGNGFFKPNISTIVGSLYPQGSPKRDGGFTIFYMGINLGAAMSPLLCGYIGETYGYHIGFGLATVGMLTGIAVFVMPVRITQVLIMAGAAAAAFGLFVYHPSNIFSTAVNVFTGTALLIAAVVAWIALSRGGLPADAGAPQEPARLRRPVLGPLTAEWAVYLGTLLFVPIFALLVYSNRSVVIIPESVIKSLPENSFGAIAAVFLEEMSKPAGLLLLLCLGAIGYLVWETFRLDRVPRQRMYVVLILTFFSMLFWAFFEQAGSSINNFTDRNVDRVLFEGARVTDAEVGKTLRFRIPPETDNSDLQKEPLLSQEQFGRQYGNDSANEQIAKAIRQVENEKQKLNKKEIEDLITATTKDNVLTITGLTYLRDAVKLAQEKADSSAASPTFEWLVTRENVGMVVGGSEIPASVFQAVNPIYILLFGVVFSALWTWLGSRGLEPNTPIKFALGLLQLGLGFGALWQGAQTADARGMVGLEWLFLGYLLHTTGELCISPVGLSMVTKLSPARLVATVMGMWFLATAYSQFLAAIIAQFTGVSHGGGGGGSIPVPKATVNVYGDVFYHIAVAGIISAVVCLALSPLLHRWMHEDIKTDDQLPGPAPTGSGDDHVRPA